MNPTKPKRTIRKNSTLLPIQFNFGIILGVTLSGISIILSLMYFFMYGPNDVVFILLIFFAVSLSFFVSLYTNK